MRVLKHVGIVLLAVALLAIAVLVAAPFVADSARVRQMLAAELGAATGKPVTFAGPVALHLFPRLEVAARDVRVANPPGYSQPWLALVGEVSARVSWPSLLRGDLDIRAVSVAGLQLALEEGPAGPNWLLPSGSGGETSLPSLPGDIHVSDATISYRAGTAEAVEVKIDAARIDPGGGTGPLSATLTARFRGEPVAVDARSGSLADLLAGKPLALRVLLDLGPTRIGLDGRIEQPLEGRGLDAAVTVDGPGLAALNAFVGGGLPPSAVVSLRAALRDRPAGGFEMGDLRVAFGDSVVEGRTSPARKGSARALMSCCAAWRWTWWMCLAGTPHRRRHRPKPMPFR